MEVTVQIGKNGAEHVLQELSAQLKKHEMVRVKINRTLIEGRQREFATGIAEDLAKKLNARVEWVKGRTFVLRRDKK